jgi:hypothetical protein
MSYYQQHGRRRGPVRVRVPFLRKPRGAGDVVAGFTGLVGVEPCEPCQRRKTWLNQRLQFVGRDQ